MRTQFYSKNPGSISGRDFFIGKLNDFMCIGRRKKMANADFGNSSDGIQSA
ncbi:MAG: hypothetical protein V4722_09160 [Bacteroidota bacterium]